MFKAVINAKALRAALKSVSEITDEARLEVSDKGIEVKTVDPANVCMVYLSMQAPAFEYFKASQGEIGVDLLRLEDALSMSSDVEPVSLQLDEENMKLLVSVGNLAYKLSLIDVTALRKPPKVPDIDLPVWVDMEGFEFNGIVKACLKVSDHIRVGMEDEKFFAAAKGDLDSVRFEREITLMKGGKPGVANSLFSLDYLEDMAKTAGKAASVHVELGIDYPMRLIVQIAEGVRVEYLLAPRIEQS